MLSPFYGIVIQMFGQDHPPPHFHALYAEHEALIDLQTLGVLGRPRRTARGRSTRNRLDRATIASNAILDRYRGFSSLSQHCHNLVQPPNAGVHLHRLVEAIGVGRRIAAPAALAHHH